MVSDVGKTWNNGGWGWRWEGGNNGGEEVEVVGGREGIMVGGGGGGREGIMVGRRWKWWVGGRE